MREGVIITSGLEDWQILQQIDGFAEVHLSGWHLSRGMDMGEPYEITARVVREDNSETVVPRTLCEHNGMYWNLSLRIPAGGLYCLETALDCPSSHGFSVQRGDMVHHFGVGDVYVIAGQSNASGRGGEPVYDPPALGVHQLRNSGVWSLASHPLGDSTGAIYLEHQESSNPGHSPYLAFAKRLRDETGYPIGLIQTALGGTGLWHWDAAEDGALLRNMLRMIRDHSPKIRGVLWYQGCTDAMEGRIDQYLARFRRVVEYTREALNAPGLPWFTVQLNRCTTDCGNGADRCWGAVREAQRLAARTIHGVYAVPALGLPVGDGIHNTSAANLIIAEYTANCALSELYDVPLIWKAPEIVSAKREGGNCVIAGFCNVYQQISPGAPGGGSFTAEDEAGQIKAIRAEAINVDTLRIAFERDIGKDAVLHGAWQANPPDPLPYDGARLPILSFYGYPIE